MGIPGYSMHASQTPYKALVQMTAIECLAMNANALTTHDPASIAEHIGVFH
jgi:hypothetical protein